MESLLNDVIFNIVLSSKPCSKFLESDGISTKSFLLRCFDNKKAAIYFKDVKELRNRVPTMGSAIAIIKNLDEYQYIICNYVPNLNDNSFYKIKFQKIRILIILFFCTFSRIVEAKDQNELDKWIKESSTLLKETSELILDYREWENKENIAESPNLFTTKVKLKQNYFNYFKEEESEIDSALYSIYGIEI